MTSLKDSIRINKSGKTHSSLEYTYFLYVFSFATLHDSLALTDIYCR
jgi:hypothetical protein